MKEEAVDEMSAEIVEEDEFDSVIVIGNGSKEFQLWEF